MFSHRFSLLVLLSSSWCCYAFQLPFAIPFFKTKSHNILNGVSSSTPRIAIVGAGASGSSAAFWISKAKERFGINVEVDVYEREAHVGGRALVVHPHDDPSLPAVELGAPVFSEYHKNIWRATQEFNLTRVTPHDIRSGFAIWDGQTIVLDWSFSTGWWSRWLTEIKTFWRYGFNAPERVNSMAKAVHEQFASLYTLESLKWDNVAYIAAALGRSRMAAQTFSKFLGEMGIPQKFTNELIEAATRLHYAQNVDEIHALQGAFSLDMYGFGILGGNQRLFEEFLNRSGSRVFLNTTVTSITARSPSSTDWTVRSSAGTINYKAVIIAAPLHLSGVLIPSHINAQVPEQPAETLHVTVLTTTAAVPNPIYFGLPPSSSVRQRILTTYEGKRQGGKEPEFLSLSYEGLVKKGEWVVKIWSRETITDDWLDDVFSKQVSWVHRKEWASLPKSIPTAVFPPLKLEQCLYYVNSFEPLVSTLEMATIASRNVVDLLLTEEFASSICGPRISDIENEDQQPLTTSEAFVLGWDC